MKDKAAQQTKEQKAVKVPMISKSKAIQKPK